MELTINQSTKSYKKFKKFATKSYFTKVSSSYGPLAYFSNIFISAEKWQHFCQKWKYRKNTQADHNLNFNYLFQPRAWGQGKKSKRTPKFLSEYHAEAIKFQAFDPRPVESREPSKQRINDFLTAIQGLPHESNWEAIPPDYDDYELSDEKEFYFNKGTVIQN